ncbi:tripartite tricarboxylate transporter substrate binding protein [Polaromonas sp. SM01]|uniref:Bug family tripartite tricarboxylate transporter substrate binding protein n=1 Tax=Polaromonas sp. SM01 TaxID=3085630 RepID=UPI002981B2CE|nr:tripartite tricarboxylate transporter substrate binding protein [Polaromonas sp. SM01]MDW5442364.1 tripartite tricarboxylate transporter substrate binding protein [Polaromonas sp. SM01]
MNTILAARQLSFCALTLLATCATATLQETSKRMAESWAPDRPVTLVVPYSAGGGTDATARAISRQLAIYWKQSVIVENVAGADGLIGTRKVIDAKPDGLTLLLQVPTILVTKYQPGFKQIDPVARLVPVTSVAEAPSVMVISPRTGASNLSELVKYCKARSEPCSIGGSDTLSRVAAKRFIAATGLTDMIYVNYRGASAAVTDVIARNLTLAFSGLASASAHQKTGTLKILMVNGPKRVKAFPEIPTATESGVSELEVLTWYGIFAPEGTPSKVINGVSNAVNAVAREIPVQQAISMSGSEPVLAGPTAFADQIKKQQTLFDDLVRRYPVD